MQAVAHPDRFFVAQIGGTVNPHVGLQIVFLGSFAFVIKKPEVILRAGVVLLAGFFKPDYGLGVILWHALAQITHDAQIVLRAGVTLFRGLAKPLGGLLEILFDADALVKKQAAFVILIGGGVPDTFFSGFLFGGCCGRFPGHRLRLFLRCAG